MAATNGQPNTPLSADLLSHGPRFGFFQAMRLLALVNKASDGNIQVRPELSLAFPACDIARIDKRTDGPGFIVTGTFLGLYGVSSPLPAFYTEDLFQDAREDSTGTRDFLDLLHRRLFDLLIAGWKKNRLFIQLAEDQKPASLDMFYALSGLCAGLPSERNKTAYPWIRYTGLLGRRPRSALGLQTMLADFLGGVPVEIIPFVPRRVQIALDQQFQLGTSQNVLGENSFLGEEFTDCQGKFRIRLGPLDRGRFRSLLQEGREHAGMVELVARYLTDPLDYDFELALEAAEIAPARLGTPEWSRLGLDMVLFSGELKENLSVVFPPAVS